MDAVETEKNIYAHNSYKKIQYHTYRNTTFLFKEGVESDKLICFFHGSISAKDHRPSKTPLPVFFGYDKSIATSPNILCFSDFLLEHYKNDKLELSWFLDTKKIKQVDSIKDVVDYYRRKYNINKIIFHGSSGGGYISLLMASHLNETAIVANSQFILEKHAQYGDLVNILEKNNDELENHGIINVLTGTLGPRRIYNYCNIDDYTVSHHRMVMSWIEDSWPNVVESHWFSGKEIAENKGVRNHAIRFPNGKKVEDIVADILQKM
jgi:hypothetical protein